MTMKEEISAELGVLLADLGESAERFGQTCIDLVTVLTVGALIAFACASQTASQTAGPFVDVSPQITGALTERSALATCGVTSALSAADAAPRSCIETRVLEPVAS